MTNTSPMVETGLEADLVRAFYAAHPEGLVSSIRSSCISKFAMGRITEAEMQAAWDAAPETAQKFLNPTGEVK